MRFIHIADIHASKERLTETLCILKTLREKAEAEKIDFILFAGDFWDSTITATKGSGFSDIVAAIRELEKVSDLIFIYGTPSHEPKGSLDVFSSEKTFVFDKMTSFVHKKTGCEIIAIPEPRRGDYIKSSPDETDKAINASLKEFINSRKITECKHRVVMYHGEVGGAMYQNGITASSPTALNKSLLQSLKAEYYALGHIHLPQEVLHNAYYSGSACPKNFGEIHDGGCNLVSIEKDSVKVERISFGLPVYQTIKADGIDGLKLQGDFSNKNIRITLCCTKEEKKSLDIRALCGDIKQRTNAVSVKIEPNITDSGIVETSSVSKRKSISEKLAEYAKEKSLAVPPKTMELLEEIKNNSLIKLSYPQHSFELLSMSLRGAIGIRDGQHKEDFELDLSKFDDGVVCLIGANGTGKCVTGESFILSDKGFETIGSYDNGTDGFRALEKRLYSDKNENDVSSHFYKEKVHKTIRICNSLGMEIEGTYNHPVLVFSQNCEFQFKKLGEIKLNDYVCIARNMNVFGNGEKSFSFVPAVKGFVKKVSVPKAMSPELARFLGYYVANGSCCSNTLQLSTGNKAIAGDYSALAEKLFDVEVKIAESEHHTAANHVINSSIVVQFMEYVFGGRLDSARYKRVPDCILQGSEQEQKEFLKALFDCDGFYDRRKNSFEYSSASKQIVTAVQNMLLNMGVISIHKEKTAAGYDWTYHRLLISSLCIDNLFYKILRGSLKYGEYSRNLEANTNIDVVPFLGNKIKKILHCSKNGRIMSKNGKSYMNPVPSGLYGGKTNLSYAKLGILMAVSAGSDIPEVQELNLLLRQLSLKFYFYSPVIKIDRLSKDVDVYDFSIPESHKFYTNGFISHNTTIIENCHPYPCMLTRNDSLKENFYLKDSHRILVYKDENGTYYRISMLIDGKNATGKTSYFAETSKDGIHWNSVPETDGSLASYQLWVSSTFGNIDIFLRTAFFAKEQTKNIPDISSTTKGERMELLSKLAGTDYLKEVSAAAKDCRKALEDESEKVEFEINAFLKYEKMIEENKKSIEEKNSQLCSVKHIVQDSKKRIAALKQADKDFQKIKLTVQTNRLLLEQYKKEMDSYQKELDTVKNVIDNRDVIEKALASKIELAEVSQEIEAENSLLFNTNTEISASKEIRAELLKKIAVLKMSKENLEKQIFDIDATCPTCGASLSDEKKKELEYAAEKNRAEIKKIETETESLEKEVSKAESDINSLQDKLDSARSEIKRLSDRKKSCEDCIEKAGNMLTQFPDYNFLELSKKADILTASIQDLQAKIDSVDNFEDVKDVSQELQEAEIELENKNNEMAELTADIKSAEKENEKYESEIAELEQNRKVLSDLKEKITAYLFIENSFSNNGIPAIELRDSAPEIADIANKILSSSYGNKFEIRFGSTSELKQKRKANEDFNIIVYDSENGDEKTIDLVSSGERIWIKQALFYAFSIVQMNRTGFNFKTRLIDESDGSLDGALRPKYLQMVASAHKIADARLTLLITHSQEIKDIVQQVIEI